MSELDEAWALALATAEDRARAAGRLDLTEYLALRNTNDLKRKIGKAWLLETFESLAGAANLAGAAIEISRLDGHRFKVGNATMVGTSLSLKKGVRVLLGRSWLASYPRGWIHSRGRVSFGKYSTSRNEAGQRRASTVARTWRGTDLGRGKKNPGTLRSPRV